MIERSENEKDALGEMNEGGVEVYITADNYVVLQAAKAGEDEPTFGIVLPFRAALADLIARFDAEGLLDPRRKKPLPR